MFLAVEFHTSSVYILGARSRPSFGGAAANLPDALFFAFVVAAFAYALEPFWR